MVQPAAPTFFMPKSLVVYVAGPFRGPNAWAIEQNVRRAEELALEVWKMGAAAICPHTNTRFYQGAAPDEVWLRGDVEIMKRCDAVVLVSGWQASSGTQVEIKEAEKAGIPVFRNRGDLFSWICANSP